MVSKKVAYLGIDRGSRMILLDEIPPVVPAVDLVCGMPPRDFAKVLLQHQKDCPLAKKLSHKVMIVEDIDTQF